MFFEELPLLVAGERVGRDKSESSDNGLRPLMQFSKRQWAVGLGVVGERRRQRNEWAGREGGVEDDVHDSGAVGWMEGHCLEMKNSTGNMLRFRCL